MTPDFLPHSLADATAFLLWLSGLAFAGWGLWRYLFGPAWRLAQRVVHAVDTLEAIQPYMKDLPDLLEAATEMRRAAWELLPNGGASLYDRVQQLLAHAEANAHTIGSNAAAIHDLQAQVERMLTTYPPREDE